MVRKAKMKIRIRNRMIGRIERGMQLIEEVVTINVIIIITHRLVFNYCHESFKVAFTNAVRFRLR